jgi:glutaryl-CoA dehydrogenase
MKPFSGVDFLGLDDFLSSEERLVRDTVRNFVSKEFFPLLGEHYKNGTFPVEIIPQLAELGLFGGSLKEYGCAGMNQVAYGLCLQELERGDSGLRSLVSVQGSLVMFPIHAYGSQKQKETWLPQMAQGKKIGCFGLTEPDFGSNPGDLLSKAEKKGNHYILNGTKRWITNGTIADVAIIWAKLEGEICGFLIEKDTPGFYQNSIHGKFSLRASDTAELILEDCKIPLENRLPEAHGLKGPLRCLNEARFGISWGALGAAMACYDEALEYAKQRVQFDRPIAGYQLVQKKLVEMLTEITKAQLLAHRMAQLKDAGKLKHYQVSMAKMNNVSMALKIARVARDILGASGITDEYQCGRHMCNLESVYTYEGTHDIHALIIGREITGLNAIHS